MRTSPPTVIAGQGIACQPFDNSGHFACKAGPSGTAREAVHAWTHPTSGESGKFCPRHSPFDWNGDHAARPDDLPDEGDRCKDCGREITWIGPSDYDWEHAESAEREGTGIMDDYTNRLASIERDAQGTADAIREEHERKAKIKAMTPGTRVYVRPFDMFGEVIAVHGQAFQVLTPDGSRRFWSVGELEL
jgi:hypothetical protein